VVAKAVAYTYNSNPDPGGLTTWDVIGDRTTGMGEHGEIGELNP